MSVQKALITRLKAGLAPHVGPRVLPGFVSDKVRLGLHRSGNAYTTVHRMGTPGLHHMGGAAGLVVRARFQIDHRAPTTAKRDAMAEAARLATDGFRGEVEGVDIRVISMEQKGIDMIEAPKSKQERPIYRSTQEVAIGYAETAAAFS
jgi:hypothetical protein